MCNQMIARAAVASMLFGGTLGANAAVTGLGGVHSHAFVGVSSVYNPSTGYNEWQVSATGSPVLGDTFVVDANFGVATVSAFNGLGMAAWANLTNPASTPEFSVQQGFQTSEAVSMTWSAHFLTGGFLRLAKFDDYTASNGGNQIGATIDWSTNAGPIGLDATNGNEYYKIFYSNYGSGAVEIGEDQLLYVRFNAVPTPGAAALVGVAGLMARRRRA